MREFVHTTGINVWLDGVKLDGVLSFNVAEGWVLCKANSPSNYANMDAKVDEILQSKLYGFVEVAH